MTSEGLPSRVVDREHRGWMLTSERLGGPLVYQDASDLGARRYLSPTELAAERGPLRPVVTPAGEGVAELRRAWAIAGRKAAYTTAVAVQLAFNELRERNGGLAAPKSWDQTREQVRAGRPGSWEAVRLFELMLWANVDKTRRYEDVAARMIAAVLVRWVADPDDYTEVAETLAAEFSAFADEVGGWRAVADQWLQQGALDRDGLMLTYGLLYSASPDFDYGVLT